MIFVEQIVAYHAYLLEQERSTATVQKYIRDIRAFCRYLKNNALNKEMVLAFKSYLLENYAAVSVNSMLVAVNGFLKFIGYPEFCVKPLKVQKRAFLDPGKELTKQEYIKLLMAAQSSENRRLYLLMQTICATGIRVSELRFITVKAIHSGRAEVDCKGKARVILIPQKLCRKLMQYVKQRGIKSGAIFVTKSGKPMDRSNIWHEMKTLCNHAGVEQSKVFPHNLRHLFARTFYAIDRDLAHLADLLGHSSMDTTRIYTMTSGAEHEKRVALLGLLL